MADITSETPVIAEELKPVSADTLIHEIKWAIRGAIAQMPHDRSGNKTSQAFVDQHLACADKLTQLLQEAQRSR